jgi:hypothetical protein
MEQVTASPNTTGPAAGKRQAWNPCDAPGALRTCGEPPAVVNGSVVSSPRWACGDVAVYHCDEGSVMLPSASTWRKCQPDGAWSGPPARCVPTPPTPSWLPQGKDLYAGDIIASKTSFLTQQGDGNLCLYRGTGPSDNHGLLWSSGGRDAAETYAVVQPDGNFCTRDYASNAAVWCAGSNQTGCSSSPFARLRTLPSANTALLDTAPNNCTFFAAVDGDKVCVHRGTSPADDHGTVWCGT